MKNIYLCREKADLSFSCIMADPKGTWRCTLFSMKSMRSLSISIKLEDLPLFNLVALK
jgi:hypothetical protein